MIDPTFIKMQRAMTVLVRIVNNVNPHRRPNHVGSAISIDHVPIFTFPPAVNPVVVVVVT